MCEPYGYKRLMSTVHDVLASVERTGTGPTANDYLVKEIENLLRSRMAEVRKWTDSTNYEKIAITLLYNTAFSAVSSGDFHIYRGELDPLKCGAHLVNICEDCIVRAVRAGYVSRDDMDESLDALYDNIEAVG